MSTMLVKTSSKGRGKDQRAGKEKASIQEECEQVHEAIKRWKAHDGAVLVPIVRKTTVAMLKEKAKPRWWKIKKSEKSTLCITTPEHLQREIDSTASDGGQVHELFLLVSRQVALPELHFDVPAGIDNLYIIRCVPSSSPTAKRTAAATPSSSPPEAKLILNGASTFCNIRLDEWQAKRAASAAAATAAGGTDDAHAHNNLILGPGVVIQLRMGIPWTARDALGAISAAQRAEVTRHFRDMCEAKYEGAPQWDKWRGPVNKLLDVAAGSASAASVVECYAGGVVVQAATRVAEVGVDGLLKVSAGLLCVAGGPGQLALAGVAVAAAIYFVPWETVWGWFRGAFGALLTWLMRAWENFKSWALDAAAGKPVVVGKQGRGVELSVRPILMSG